MDGALDCGCSVGGDITFTENLDCSASEGTIGLNVEVNNATIDLAGYSIVDDGDQERGISVAGYDGTTIKNGTIDATGTLTFIWVDDAHNTTIQDMTFKNATTDNNQGVVWINDSDNPTVTRCTFQDNVENMGLYWLGNSDVATFTYNTFTGSNYENGSLWISGDDAINDGAGERATIAYNTFTAEYVSGDVRGDGHMIGIGGGTASERPIKRVDIYNNTITGSGLKSQGSLVAVYNTEDVNIYNNFIYENDALEAIGVGTHCTGTDIYNNVIVNNDGNDDAKAAVTGVIFLQQATSDCAACDDLVDVTIYNNTIANNDDANGPTAHRGAIAFECANDATFTINNVVIKNNIIYENLTSVDAQNHSFYSIYADACGVTNLDLDNNDWRMSANADNFMTWQEADDDGDGTTINTYTFAQFAAYQAAESQDANSLNVNPNPVNASGSEARAFAPMNPDMRAGTTGSGIPTTDYFGIKYDGIGAINDTRKLTILDD